MKTIALTGASKPLVIISDWAINGTEISRFGRWAAAYVEALGGLRDLRVASAPLR